MSDDTYYDSLSAFQNEEHDLARQPSKPGTGYCDLCDEPYVLYDYSVFRPRVGTIHNWHKSKPGDIQ